MLLFQKDVIMVREDTKWYAVFVASSWLSNIGQGLVNTVVGPTQPYLAQNVGVKIDLINLVWTFGFGGYLLGALACGMVFKKYKKDFLFILQHFKVEFYKGV